MTRTVHRMFDSTGVGDIPASAGMIAVYADGRYAGTELAAKARFPHATIVTITVNGTANHEVCDCETGDLTASQAAAWARSEIAHGRHPTIYCSESPWPVVRAAVRAAGIIESNVSWWIAKYDGDPTIPAGAVAKQYLGSPGNSPGHYDESSVADYWPGVDPKPTGSPFVPDMAKAVNLATNRFTDRVKHKDPMDAKARAATHALIEAATHALAIKP